MAMTPWKVSLGALTIALTASLIGSQGCVSGPDVPGGVGGPSGPIGAEPSVFAIYAVPASLDALAEETFFDHPWPSDLRIENGSPRFKGFYNPKPIPILGYYIDAMDGLVDGFSPAGAGYLRFTGAIDTDTLPATPKDAQDPDASVQLIDVDPNSPEYGTRKLVSISFHAERGLYYLPDTLAFIPTPGFPLRPHTRYALVVTDALHAEDGTPIGQSETVAMLVGAKAPNAATQAASAALADAVGEIQKAGIAREHIVHLAVFTTADPTKELIAVRDGVAKTSDPPTADADMWKVGSSNATYTEYQGSYGPSPNYQAGTLPFISFGSGGQFVFENGLPVVQSVSDLRFSLTVPSSNACPMPPRVTRSCSTRTVPAATGGATSPTVLPGRWPPDASRPWASIKSSKAHAQARFRAPAKAKLGSRSTTSRTQSPLAPTAARLPSTRCSARASSRRATSWCPLRCRRPARTSFSMRQNSWSSAIRREGSTGRSSPPSIPRRAVGSFPARAPSSRWACSKKPSLSRACRSSCANCSVSARRTRTSSTFSTPACRSSSRSPTSWTPSTTRACRPSSRAPGSRPRAFT
ncbi:MAG: hypothetical protein IPM54_08510 [Polyangiaceae bacterium]|nr:hypothetical protein [Polyangiaceae bacterium]